MRILKSLIYKRISADEYKHFERLHNIVRDEDLNENETSKLNETMMDQNISFNNISQTRTDFRLTDKDTVTIPDLPENTTITQPNMTTTINATQNNLLRQETSAVPPREGKKNKTHLSSRQ